MAQTALRTLLVVAALLAAGVALPAGAVSPPAPSVQTLQNPGLEGSPSRANGFELLLDGAQTSPVAHGGQQSVDLGKAGAAPQPSGSLGEARAYLAQPADLASITGLSYWYEAPNPSRGMALAETLHVDLDGDGAADACLVDGAGALPFTPAYAQRALDASAAFAPCAGGPSQSLAAFAAANPGATLLSLSLTSVVSGGAAWPQGAPLYVDDLAVQAAAIRVVPAVLDTCAEPAHPDPQEAIGCAAAGATVLLAPGVYAGFDVTKGLTVCATGPGGAACQDRSDAVVDGRADGLSLVRMLAPDATLRGLVLQNPNLTATDQSAGASVGPALLLITGDRDVARHNVLRANGAQPGPLASRWMTYGIDVAGGDDVLLDGNDVSGLPASRGVDGTCAHAPCGVVGVHVAPAAHRLVADGNSVTMGAASPSSAYLLEGDGATVRDSFAKIAANSSASPLDAAIVRAYADDVNVSGNIFQPSASTGVAPLAVYARGANLVMEHDSLLRFERGVDADLSAGGALTGLVFSSTDRPIALRGGSPVLLENYVVSGASTAVSLDGASAARLSANLLRGTTALALGPGVRGASVDARENDWGVYSRAAILGKIADQGSGNAVDVSCYVDSIPTARVCPPTAGFTLQGASWGKPMAFADASQSGGRAIVSWAWTFSDGATATGAQASHAFAAPGPASATLTVTDSDGWTGATTRAFDVSDAAPVLSPIGDRVVGEGERLAFRLSAADPDQDNVTFSATGLPEGATFDTASGSFSWTPDFTQEGAYGPVTFAASDGFLSDAEAINLTVGHRNAPPLLSIEGPLAASEGSVLSFLARGSDVDGDRVSLFDSGNPVGARFSDLGNGTAQFSWTPDYTQAGTYNLTLQAWDGHNLTQNVVALRVADLDRAPAFSPIPAARGREMQPLQLQVAATDPDGDALAYSATHLPAGASFDPNARVLRWTPTYLQAGTYVVTFRANDGNLTASADATLVIDDADRAPTLAPLPDQAGRAGATLRVPLAANDPDSDPLTFSSPDAPPGVSFSGATLVWASTPAQAGSHTLTVVASDGTLNASQTLNVSLAVNAPPVVSLTLPASANVTVAAPFSGWGSADPDGDSRKLSYAWDFDPSDGFQAQAKGANVSWTFATVGPHVVTLRVTDQDGVVSERNATLVVDDRLTAVAWAYLETPTRGLGFVTLRDPPFGALAHHDVDVQIGWQPSPGGPEVPLHQLTATTRDDGSAMFPLPVDAVVMNLPGTHVIHATATLEGSYGGDTETATSTATYTPGILP